MTTPSPAEDEGTSRSNLNPDLEHYSRSDAEAGYSTADYVKAIREGDRVMLGRAITLVESTRAKHQAQARQILDACLPHTGDSIRVAVTGAPGVGKSTFIDTLGPRLVDAGRHLAVLVIDPTSEHTRGSILGDKTRMGRLAHRDEVFIRPSPTAGSPGGVARRTRETILLCEAAGFDTVLVETVGVGQSETTVHSMVDFFLLLALAGAGDELQGIKRGIVERADAMAINKADGENRRAAEQAQSAYRNALDLFPTPASRWSPPVLTCSARTGEGVDAVWQVVEEYCAHTKASSFFEARRRRQARYWMYQTIERRLREDFFSDPNVQEALDEVEAKVEAGRLSSFAGAEQLLTLHRRARPSKETSSST